MESLQTSVPALEAIPLPSVRAFLQSRGYLYRERWGSHLDRFSKKLSGREDHVLVPIDREILDFEKRMADVVETLSRQLKIPAPLLLKQVVNSGYEVVRIRANEGEQSSTISYDAAIDLLRGGFALIDSSAVVAMSDDALRIVRGRRPDAVRRYLDRVRVGQTEVGSFVLTLLMPLSVESDELGFSESVGDSFGRHVAQKMSAALRATKTATRRGEFGVREISEVGVTANFSGGIARMIQAVGDVTISLAPAVEAKGSSRYSASKFERADLPALKELERRLTPKEQRKPVTLTGTVTEFREPSRRTSGTIALEADIYGEFRPVRLSFTQEDRSTVLEALERKADLLLSVSGELISRGGHYQLDDARDFDLIRRGPLA